MAATPPPAPVGNLLAILTMKDDGTAIWSMVKEVDLVGLPPGALPPAHVPMTFAQRTTIYDLSVRVPGGVIPIGMSQIYGRAGHGKLGMKLLDHLKS